MRCEGVRETKATNCAKDKVVSYFWQDSAPKKAARDDARDDHN